MAVSKTYTPPNKHVTARKPIKTHTNGLTLLKGKLNIKPKVQLEPFLLMNTFVNTIIEKLSESDSD
jgi:hypothetical protein